MCQKNRSIAMDLGRPPPPLWQSYKSTPSCVQSLLHEVVGGWRSHVISMPFGIAHTCHVTDLKDSTAKVSCDTIWYQKNENFGKNDDTHVL